jgi:hypothetical protein
MSRDNIWPIVIAALVGALLGGGAVWAIQGRTTAELTTRVARADADTQAALQQIAELKSAAASAQSPANTSSAGSTTPTEPAAPTTTTTTTSTPAPAKSITVRQFGYVSKVNVSGSRPVISVDYAIMLTGTAAAKAATAHGDESPPPNDYYIVNDNKLIRKLPVKRGIAVTVTTNDDGTDDPSGHVITFAKWAAAYATPTATNASLREAPYWLTIKNGVVTVIAEQYLP